MSEPMTRGELVTHLRDLADLYETMGVDKLPRDLMRNAANTIARLTSEMEACRRRAEVAENQLEEIYAYALEKQEGTAIYELLEAMMDIRAMARATGPSAANSPGPGGEVQP